VYFLQKIFSRVIKWQKQFLGAQAQATYFIYLHCGSVALHCKRKHILGLRQDSKHKTFKKNPSPIAALPIPDFQVSMIFQFVSNFSTTVAGFKICSILQLSVNVVLWPAVLHSS
jgi:hypothetical protein